MNSKFIRFREYFSIFPQQYSIETSDDMNAERTNISDGQAPSNAESPNYFVISLPIGSSFFWRWIVLSVIFMFIHPSDFPLSLSVAQHPHFKRWKRKKWNVQHPKRHRKFLAALWIICNNRWLAFKETTKSILFLFSLQSFNFSKKKKKYSRHFYGFFRV